MKKSILSMNALYVNYREGKKISLMSISFDKFDFDFEFDFDFD